MVSVDDINDNSVALTILCYADIEAICSFTDYANSAWDGEENAIGSCLKKSLKKITMQNLNVVLNSDGQMKLVK